MLTVILQIAKSLRLTLINTNLTLTAVNTNLPIFSAVKRWRISPNFMLHNVIISLKHVLQNVCGFYVDLILYLFIYLFDISHGNLT